MSAKRILVITNSGSFEKHLITWLANCWREAGHQVEFVSDLNTKKEADIAFLHVDLTDVPPAYLKLARKYPVVINGRNKSISKELYSNQMLEQNCGYEGRVIVKTKDNCGGLSELNRGVVSRIKRLIIKSIREITLSDSIDLRFIKSLAWRNVRALDPYRYPVFDSINEVPPAIWENSRLIVEKYLPEQDENGLFVIRHWYFFGDREFNRTFSGSKQVQKWGNLSEDERIKSQQEWFKTKVVNDANIPAEVRAVREKLRMDFGRIDWAFHNGMPVVFDANRTPAFSVGESAHNSELDARRRSLICKYSEGIEYFNSL